LWIILPFFGGKAGGHLWPILKGQPVLSDGHAMDMGLPLDPPIGPAQTDHALNNALFVHPQNVPHSAFPFSDEKGKGGYESFWGGLF
jgi:hypothetical protein